MIFRLLLVGAPSRLPGKEATMTPEDTGQDRHHVAQKGKPDWVFIGSLVLIVISLLGMAYITWSRYELGR